MGNDDNGRGGSGGNGSGHCHLMAVVKLDLTAFRTLLATGTAAI